MNVILTDKEISIFSITAAARIESADFNFRTLSKENHDVTNRTYKYALEEASLWQEFLYKVNRTDLIPDDYVKVYKMSMNCEQCDGLRYEVNANLEQAQYHHIVCVNCGRIETATSEE